MTPTISCSPLPVKLRYQASSRVGKPSKRLAGEAHGTALLCIAVLLPSTLRATALAGAKQGLFVEPGLSKPPVIYARIDTAEWFEALAIESLALEG